jgi:hypothetical protein
MWRKSRRDENPDAFGPPDNMLDATGEIRRALELLASCRDGCTEAMMIARGSGTRGGSSPVERETSR